ncbi:hypothetical protein ScPMuIL_000688 [Solemya velum]
MGDKDKQISDLRSRVMWLDPIEGDEDFIKQDETLVRYLKSRDWNVDEAEKMLKRTVEYRRQTRPMELECSWCHEKAGYHSMRQVGFDEVGRPVIYSNFSQAAACRSTVEDAIAHCTYLIENAKRSMKPGISSWVFIMDCTGMTMQACNPKLGYGVTQVMANHYPERLGLVICINHNPVFQGVWRAMKLFLHPNTLAKMKLIRSKRKVVSTFQKYFPDELVTWLREEIKLNKQKPLPTFQAEFWKRPSRKSDHDPRGCPSYVEQYLENYEGNTFSNKHSPHKPHPNIVDSIEGRLERTIVTQDEVVARLRAQEEAGRLDEMNSDAEDESASEIEISKEFQIPKDASKLFT